GLPAVGLPDVVHHDDVRAAHPAQAASLGDEAFPHLGVEAVVLGEHLEDDDVLQPLVDGPVHGGEGAHADDPVEAVPPDAFGAQPALVPSCRPVLRRAAATSARPRATCDFTAPTLRPSRSATSVYGRPSTSRRVTGPR